MRLHVEWPYRRREQHGRGSGGGSLLDEAQHRVVLPAGPSLHLAGPDVLHPGVADRAIVVEQNADDEAFVVCPFPAAGPPCSGGIAVPPASSCALWRQPSMHPQRSGEAPGSTFAISSAEQSASSAYVLMPASSSRRATSCPSPAMRVRSSCCGAPA